MSQPRGRLLQSDDELRALLLRIRTVAVVGYKPATHEAAHRIPAYMHDRGYRILAVNPKATAAFGVDACASLGELQESPDLVNLFRAPAHLPGHTDEILALPAPPVGVWMQSGIRHPAAAERLLAAGIDVVQDRCLMVEHGRLLGPSGPARVEPEEN